jgi:hypothetical protein
MAYLRNRSPTRANGGVTPLERLTGVKPDLANLRVFGCPVSVAIPAQKRQKWDMKSKLGYLVGYDTYSTGYLVWFPGTKKAEKVREAIFHENAVVPATPVPYGDDAMFNHDEANAIASPVSRSGTTSRQVALSATQPTATTHVPKTAPQSHVNPANPTRLSIRIPARPAVPNVSDLSPLTDIETGAQPNVAPPNQTTPSDRLVSAVPDYPHGSTRSGRVRNDYRINIAFQEEAVPEQFSAFSATSEDPMIAEALSMPGEEGRAWEAARQAEWENMVKFDVFGPPAEPPPGVKVLKTGTVCRGTYRNGILVKWKV